jgi:hypothetical protein
MKTKIALAVAVVALFVAVPSASPKHGGGSGPASVGATIGCTENTNDDSCIVSFTGLNSSGTTYKYQIADPCGYGGAGGNISGVSSYSVSIPTAADCGVPFTISLSTVGRGSTLTPVPVTITYAIGTDPGVI